MTWDKNKIEKQFIDLEFQINSTDDEQVKRVLKYDYNVLYDILKSINSAVKFNQDFLYQKKEYSFSYSNFLLESFEQISFHKKDFLDLSKIIEAQTYNLSKIFISRNIPFVKLIEMIKEFLTFFDTELYDLMQDYSDEQINFFKFSRNKKTLTKLGLCYPIFSTNKSFVAIDYHKKDNIDTLPHELAHAKEFLEINDFNEYLCWKVSSFVESYPNFVSLAFLDYHQSGEYGDLCLEKKQLFFDSTKLMIDNYIYNIYYMKDYDLNSNCIIDNNNKAIRKKEIDYIISNLVSIYMLNLYYNDYDEFKNFIENFHSFIGKSDKNIWELLDMHKLSAALIEESNRLNSSINMSRKRTKNF